MKTTLCVLSYLLASLVTLSQDASGLLEINQIKCSVSSSGNLFITPGQTSGTFEVPTGQGARTIYAAHLWIGGISPDQQLKLVAEQYGANGSAWFPGPLSTDGSASISSEVSEASNHVWVCNAADVNVHIAYFNALANGTVESEFPNGYSIPLWFFDWPAHGNLTENQDFYLAPYFDLNADGLYDPTQGDHPVFCGDQGVYFIINDKANANTESLGQPIGLEVHGMLYGFETTADDMLQNTVFLDYNIINRGTQTLTNTYAGFWADFDLGNPTDDYVGTDVQRGAIYTYNSDSFDELSSAGPGYAQNPPMQGIVFLSGPFADEDGEDNALPDNSYSAITSSYGPFVEGYGDGIIDNERLGLGYSIYYNNSSNSINGNPVNPIHYYNFMRGIWKNGQQLAYGTDGVQGSGNQSNYVYVGDSDPLHLSSGQSEEFWDEASGGNVSGDRKMLGSSGPFTLEPGEENHFNLAFVFADGDIFTTNLNDAFKNRMTEAKLFYNDYLSNCLENAFPVGIGEMGKSTSVSLFPNPSNGLLRISGVKPGTLNTLTILDHTGKIAMTQTISFANNSIDASHLTPGVYTVVFDEDNNRHIKRLVIVR